MNARQIERDLEEARRSQTALEQEAEAARAEAERAKRTLESSPVEEIDRLHAVYRERESEAERSMLKAQAATRRVQELETALHDAKRKEAVEAFEAARKPLDEAAEAFNAALQDAYKKLHLAIRQNLPDVVEKAKAAGVPFPPEVYWQQPGLVQGQAEQVKRLKAVPHVAIHPNRYEFRLANLDGRLLTDVLVNPHPGGLIDERPREHVENPLTNNPFPVLRR